MTFTFDDHKRRLLRQTLCLINEHSGTKKKYIHIYLETEMKNALQCKQTISIEDVSSI